MTAFNHAKPWQKKVGIWSMRHLLFILEKNTSMLDKFKLEIDDLGKSSKLHVNSSRN